jgi:hypothetical protein
LNALFDRDESPLMVVDTTAQRSILEQYVAQSIHGCDDRHDLGRQAHLRVGLSPMETIETRVGFVKALTHVCYLRGCCIESLVGSVEMPGNQLDAVVGPVETANNLLDAVVGLVEAPSNLLDAVVGLVEAPSNLLDALVGQVDARGHLLDTAVGQVETPNDPVDLLVGQVDAPTQLPYVRGGLVDPLVGLGHERMRFGEASVRVAPKCAHFVVNAFEDFDGLVARLHGRKLLSMTPPQSNRQTSADARNCWEKLDVQLSGFGSEVAADGSPSGATDSSS